jgi:hypothetical protein
VGTAGPIVLVGWVLLPRVGCVVGGAAGTIVATIGTDVGGSVSGPFPPAAQATRMEPRSQSSARGRQKNTNLAISTSKRAPISYRQIRNIADTCYKHTPAFLGIRYLGSLARQNNVGLGLYCLERLGSI